MLFKDNYHLKNQIMTKTIILFLFLLFNINSFSQSTTAQSSGDWDAVSWSNGAPSCGSHDDIVIPRGLKITNKNGTII